jgi:hypothetical protein
MLGNKPEATLAAYKERRLERVTGREKEGAPTWSFYYLAVMKQPAPTKTLSIDFLHKGKLAARKVMVGWNQRLTVLRGHLDVSTDDGLAPGVTYEVQLIGVRPGGKGVLLARTNFTAAPLPAPEKTSQR